VLTPLSGGDIAGRGCSYATTDSHGRIWLGFQRGGVAYYDGAFHILTQKDGLAAGPVLAIHEDSGGDIWIGTTSGVSRWSNGRFSTAMIAESFDGRFNSALIDDAEGQIWLGANSGAAILRFSRRDLDAFSVDRRRLLQYAVYDASDGLQGPAHWASRPAVARDAAGRLWFATGNGVVIIDPHHPPPLHRPSAPRVERITADGRSLDPSAPINLSNASSVAIAYSAISLSSGSKIRFRYMLEGFKNTWTETGTSRTATFEHLAPGRYRFRVAATTDGNWIENDSGWEFAVRPPFYQTIVFYALLAAVALLTAWGYWQLRLRTVRKQFALVLAERARVGREIHDTLLQSLGAVGVELEVVASQLRSTEAPVADAVTRLRREVTRCIREARESIWELRSSRLETRDLTSALEELADDVGTARAVQVDVHARGRAWQGSPEADEQLLRIAQEAVGNAVRHGRAKRVRVSLDYEREHVALRVADDGCGFSPSEHRGHGGDGEHWGLTTMRERAQRIGGELRIISGRGEGTVVETIVPRSEGA
jgi:signal transduction histidine kinase